MRKIIAIAVFVILFSSNVNVRQQAEQLLTADKVSSIETEDNVLVDPSYDTTAADEKMAEMSASGESETENSTSYSTSKAATVDKAEEAEESEISDAEKEETEETAEESSVETVAENSEESTQYAASEESSASQTTSNQSTTTQNSTSQNSTTNDSTPASTASQSSSAQNSQSQESSAAAESSQVVEESSEESSAAPHTHSYAVTYYKPATCDEDGKQIELCDCGETIVTTLEKLGGDHDYWIVSTTATCTSAGTYTASCSRCGHEITGSMDHLGDGTHTFADYGGDMCSVLFCTTCGYTEVTARADQSSAIYNSQYYTNSFRAEVGLGSLSLSSYLCSLAQQRAVEIASDFSHSGFRGCNGENIAYGYNDSSGACYAWKASASHYENIVRDWFTEYGFGFYVSPSGTVYCVQLFN